MLLFYRLKNEKDISRVVGKMQKEKFSFIAKEIYICEIDKWWQVKNIIKKIDSNLPLSVYLVFARSIAISRISKRKKFSNKLFKKIRTFLS